jgi:hypothetical protein
MRVDDVNSVGVESPGALKGEVQMQIDWSKTSLGDYDITAYVFGSETEKERQKTEIQAAFLCKIASSGFVSDWQEVEHRLTETEPKSRFMLVVSDLGAVSRDPRELAERLIIFIITHATLSPINKEQENWWNNYQKTSPENWLKLGAKDRVLQSLEDRCRELLERDAQEGQAENKTA